LHKGLEVGRRLQHVVDNQELKDSFKNLYLVEEIENASEAHSADTSVASASAST
jgi:hypothetical protein